MEPTGMPPEPAAEAAIPPTPSPDAPVPPPGMEDEEEPRRRRRRLLFLLFALLALLLVLLAFTGWYLINRKPITDLLPPIGLDEPPRYLFSIYNAAKPMGVAVTASGDRVYVTESAGDRLVRVFDQDGNPVGELRPPEDGLPHAPVYLAVDQQSGEVWVTDRITGAIYVYDASGAYLREFEPSEPITDWQPVGIALAPNGDVWVTDLSAPYHRVEVFDREGTLKQTLGEPDQFLFPNMIAFDAAGNAYVTDSNNGRLIVIDPAGAISVGIGRGSSEGDLGLPRGTAIDDKGRLYVVDATGHQVRLYRTVTPEDGRPAFMANVGTQGTGDGQFEYPNGVATDTRARVYVTDRENDRVQVWGY
jgi:DNA-binding beta-propeller fold protein YncE